MKALIALCLAVFLNNTAKAEQVPEPPLVCGDFLKQLGLQRPDVKFVSCESLKDAGVWPEALQAVYQVEGKDIAKVENWLVRLAKVKRLRFVCCGWETPNEGMLEDRNGSTFVIGMGGEAMVTERKDFPKIPYLNVYVRHYLYEP
ncbi:DUF4952 domain-containing protein [Paraburkholderia solisilvae]|uniref:DUF4952 domain-containing protein n=1 Tax=Paraburkholderia solisilvae TaxID=624376 RepID=A0A6J5DZZ5_9BURK|nr:DUF4952 domain-containing protein [Paraburkholderia solisilvae]CAB3759034.1 hypothetical protein LMG29739_03062 [Paraburkholderia solisilvae]